MLDPLFSFKLDSSTDVIPQNSIRSSGLRKTDVLSYFPVRASPNRKFRCRKKSTHIYYKPRTYVRTFFSMKFHVILPTEDRIELTTMSNFGSVSKLNVSFDCQFFHNIHHVDKYNDIAHYIHDTGHKKQRKIRHLEVITTTLSARWYLIE